MCGIVGYVSDKKIIPFLLDGLYRLEYRGYDSSGIATIDENGLNLYKEVGRIKNLDKLIPTEAKETVSDFAGIAHTRWATHGGVNVSNSHPHIDENKEFTLVHNGIIENYKTLKTKLETEGVKFYSETDSEVLLQVIKKYYNGDLEEAVKIALTKVVGAYGIAVMTVHEPGVIVGARNGSPLVLGVGKDENVLASDVMAVRSVTDNVIFLQDGQVVKVTKDDYEISSLTDGVVEAKITKVDWDNTTYDKDGYETFMLKEINEQQQTIIDTIRGRLFAKEGKVVLRGLEELKDEIKRAKKITIIACGTSWHAAQVGKYWIETLAGVPVEVDYAAEFRYRNPIIIDDHIVIAISQSGETADTIGAIREAQLKGAKVLGITNVVGSTIARETDAGVFLHAGPEIGVASTKAFTGQLTVLLMVALYMGRFNRLSMEEFHTIATEFEKIPEQISKILAQTDKIQKVAKTASIFSNVLYLGRGVNFPVALEGALKLKEISYIHAEGYSAAEMKHGPIALIDENMPSVVIATQDFQYEKVVSNMQEIKARKGRILAIATEGDKEIASHADFVVYVPKTLDLLAPFLTVIPLQLLSYYAALEKGCDVDKPRNLAKSVTVE